jgi:RimJ/RimL family protein N-acetyltransferase
VRLLIRVATLEDAEALAEIIAEVASEGTIGPEAPVDVSARVERFREAIRAPTPDAVRVLEQDGDVVGYADLRQAAKGVLVLGMAILPIARGHGGGRGLLEGLLDHASEHGAHKVELEVWVDNAPAISLYASCGFEVEGIKRDHYRRKNRTLRSAMLMAKHVGD